MKEITIYELLGLVKDGKAPKQFNYKGYTYTYHEDTNEYYDQEENRFIWTFNILMCLNDTVQIIEEEKGNRKVG